MKYAFPLIVSLLSIGCAFAPVDEDIGSAEYESQNGDKLGTVSSGNAVVHPGVPSPNLECRGECVTERNSCRFFERERRALPLGCVSDPYDPGILVSSDQGCTELLAYSADECISGEEDPRQPETPDDDWF